MRKLTMLVAVVSLLASCHMATQKKEQVLIGSWIEVMPENLKYVQGVTLNADGTAASIGMATLKYETWSLKDNKLILNGKSIGNRQTLEFSDTLDVVVLTPDSLTLLRHDTYRIDYYRVNEPSISEVEENLLDSLPKSEGTGDLQSRVYLGTLPAASCPGIVYEITLYNYEFSGDGVFKMRMTYLEAENGEDYSLEYCGRQYTLRGCEGDDNAVVFQFVPFDRNHDIINFRFDGEQLTMLDCDFKPIDSDLNYSLQLQ